MPFADLIHGAELQGDAAHLDVGAATRLGRAFGTALRRRAGGGPKVVALARSADDDALPVRDGLVRGLLLTGHDVRDLGVADAALLSFAVDHLDAAGAVLVTAPQGGARSVRLFLGRRSLPDELLAEVAALADGDEFSAGTGALSLVDLHGALRAAGARG